MRADGRPPARHGITATRVVLREVVPEGEYWAAAAGDSPWPAGTLLTPGTALDRPQPAWHFPVLAPEEPIPFHYEVLYEDEELVVVDKPHFLPATSNGRLVRETVQTRLRRDYGEETTPLHRLDRLTAGVLLAARTPKARSAYQPLFQQRRVRRTYLARVHGNVHYPHWELMYLRMRGTEGRRQVKAGTGTETLTRIRSHADYPDAVWLEPITGHTHQLRVLLNSLGAPIVGDDTYPVDKGLDLYDFSSPLQLLAYSVELPDGRVFRTKRTLVDMII